MATVSPRPSPTYSRWRLTKRERRNFAMGILFISPWLIGFLAFLAYPIAYTVRIAFTRYSGFGDPQWIGLDNFRQMFDDPVYRKAVYNTAYYTLLAVPVGLVLAIILGLLMSIDLPETGIFRTIIYIPSLVPLFTLAFIYQILLNPTRGIFNQIIMWFGLPNINWFGDPRYAKIALVILAQYGAGQAGILFLAAMKGIPRSLYEAASLDGATGWRKFIGITLPLITPVILYDIVIGISLGVQIFTQIYILSGNPAGGPVNSTMSVVLYFYYNAFSYGQMGYASAMALVLFLFTTVAAGLIFFTSRWWVNYDTI